MGARMDTSDHTQLHPFKAPGAVENILTGTKNFLMDYFHLKLELNTPGFEVTLQIKV